MIAYKLRRTYFIELETGNVSSFIERDFEKNSYERTENCLHLRANDVNLGPFPVYIQGNTTPQMLEFYSQLPDIITANPQIRKLPNISSVSHPFY